MLTARPEFRLPPDAVRDRPFRLGTELREGPPAGYAAAALGYAIGWLILAFPWLSGRVTIPWDAKAHFLPQIQFLADSLWRGDSPFWNPFVFSGHPQIADPQSLIFSPPFLLLALVNPAPTSWAVDVTVYIVILLSGFALMAWMRDRNWHPIGALIGVLAYAFGAAMAWRVQHTGQVVSLAYLPLVLFLLDRSLDAARSADTGLERTHVARILYGLASGITAAFVVLGRDQVALVTVYLLIGFVAWRLMTSGDGLTSAIRRNSVPLIVAALAGLAIVALPVALSAALADQTNRPTIDYLGAGRGSLHPALGLTLFIPDLFGATGSMWDYWGPPSYQWDQIWGRPDLNLAQNMGQLYIGAIPALLLILGAFSGIMWHRDVRFFTLALAAVAIYALGRYTPAFEPLHAYLPGVALFRRPADALFPLGLLAAILSGYTAHRLLTIEAPIPAVRLRNAIIATAAVAGLAFAAAFWFAVRMDRIEMASRPMILSAVAFLIAATIIADAVWFNPIRPALGGLLLAGFTVIDLAWFNGPSSSTAMKPAQLEFLDPRTQNETIELLRTKTAAGTAADPNRLDRIELAGLGFHWPNASMTHRLHHTLGYNPVRLSDYVAATGAGDTIGLPQDRAFPPLFPSYGSKLADVLGLRYIVSKVEIESLDRRIQPGRLEFVGPTLDGFVYENTQALPRVLFAGAARSADFDEMIRTGAWPEADLTSTVLLSAYDEKSSGLIASRASGEVRLVAYRNTEVVVESQSQRGGFVVLHDPWHPWWTATIDGVAAPILKANVLFRAVRVPPGRHTVRFRFEPVRGVLGLARRQ
ncbi:MAG: hypothetical protein SH859_09615 [Hyphomicrobium aestuarii]|nr:hypothetical protein [Hyphomicrobium aestuarii]